MAGYPGGTDIPASKDRVKMFTDRLREMGVEIVPEKAKRYLKEEDAAFFD